jgi:hypothetical protein
MKRIALIIALLGTVSAAGPAAAQWQGMPVWNSPKGGTGLTVNGDVGFPSADAGEGTAYGARATLGFTALSVTAGLSSWKPDGATESSTTWGGTAQFRVIGGSLMPVALNLQAGWGSASETASLPKISNYLVGAGISVNLPTPGLSIEPYLSVSNRWHDVEGASTESNIGWVLGANVGFGMLGAHLAYDSESASGGTKLGAFGIGLHYAFKAPVGM